MKKKLFLITDSFPYGKGEKPFIKPELPYLQEEFEVNIVSCADEVTKNDADNITELGSDVHVLSLVPETRRRVRALGAIKLLFSSDLWQEWGRIVKGGTKILPRLRYALGQYVNAELFYRQLVQVAQLEEAVVYTYWNNVRTLGVCHHKHEHRGLKIVTRVHGYDLYNERGLAGRQYFRWLVNRELDAIFFVSQKGFDYYRDKFAVDSKKIFFCPLGISEMPVSPALQVEDDFILVSCSNVISLKRVDLIIKALASVRSNRKIHWIHFGDGSEMSSIREIAHKLLTARGNISYELRGQEDNAKIRLYYAAHAVGGFITTSSTEGGAPVSIQEALCAAVPVIGTDVGGIPEMIAGNGILLPASPDVEEVAAVIEKLVSLPIEKHLTWKVRSREIWQEKYVAEKNYRRFMEVLVRLAQ